jgi:molybdate transport system substrate-binding protein
MSTRRSFFAGLAALALTMSATAGQAAEKITVFAAASLKNALDAAAASWRAETGKEAVVSYAASSALARQIEQGAPADIFFSADVDWMNYLTERSLMKPETTIELLGNEIVLIVPRDSSLGTRIEKGFPLARLLGDGRLAMADVKAVPAGKYSKAALESLGVWADVEGRIAQAENVRAALKLVATGEAPLGIVYRTDAVAEPAVKVIGAFPQDSHPPIIYPVAITAESASADAAAFLSYLQSSAAQAIFREQGFTLQKPAATN